MSDKPLWIRHKPGCGQRVFNDPIDIQAHTDYCPAELLRKIKNLTTALDKLDTRVVDLEETEIEIPAAQTVDLDDVGAWTGPNNDEDDAYAGEPDEDATAEPVRIPYVETSGLDDYPPAIDRDDDLDTRLANATGTVNL